MPIKYVGLSHCFRTEAGAAGRASRGLYRVHQFTKVEMFAFTTPGDSGAIHAEMLAIEEQIFQALGIPYRVLDICTGDLGGPAYRKFDLEAWMPGRGEHGEYGEVTSTSDCTDYQSRRLNIRYRPGGQKGTRFVHTLNGTAVALIAGPDRDPGELPAGRRPDRRSRGAPAVPRQGRDRSSLNPPRFRTRAGSARDSGGPFDPEDGVYPVVISVRSTPGFRRRRVWPVGRLDDDERRQARAKPAPGARPARADPERRSAALREFIEDQHPGRTAELIEDLEAKDGDALFRSSCPRDRAEVLTYLDTESQNRIVEAMPPEEAAESCT